MTTSRHNPPWPEFVKTQKVAGIGGEGGMKFKEPWKGKTD